MYIYMYMLLFLEIIFYYLIFKMFHEKKIFIFVKIPNFKAHQIKKINNSLTSPVLS